MAGAIKGLISEFTGGLFGNGQAPAPYQGGNIADSQPDPLKWDANGAASDMASKYFGQAMDTRNGGMQKAVIGKLFGIGTQNAAQAETPIMEGDI